MLPCNCSLSLCSQQVPAGRVTAAAVAAPAVVARRALLLPLLLLLAAQAAAALLAAVPGATAAARRRLGCRLLQLAAPLAGGVLVRGRAAVAAHWAEPLPGGHAGQAAAARVVHRWAAVAEEQVACKEAWPQVNCTVGWWVGTPEDQAPLLDAQRTAARQGGQGRAAAGSSGAPWSPPQAAQRSSWLPGSSVPSSDSAGQAGGGVWRQGRGRDLEPEAVGAVLALCANRGRAPGSLLLQPPCGQPQLSSAQRSAAQRSAAQRGPHTHSRTIHQEGILQIVLVVLLCGALLALAAAAIR